VFSDPPPSDGDLSHFYSPSGDWGAPRARLAEDAEDAPARRYGRERWRQLFDIIDKELSAAGSRQDASVLDFGCGSGDLLDLLQDDGWTTWGIEPAVDDAFRRHRRLTSIPDEPGFDLIIANHVLEHVTDPIGLLRQFARASRPGRFLLLGVPRFDTLPVHRDYKYVINGRAHVTAYTWACMQGLLARTGWSPVGPPPAGASADSRKASGRMRVLARRVEGTLPLPDSPAAEARTAMRAYQHGLSHRSALERLGLFRVAARRVAREYRRAREARRSERRNAAAS
jgi:SAM-dependent methyltransferase